MELLDKSTQDLYKQTCILICIQTPFLVNIWGSSFILPYMISYNALG